MPFVTQEHTINGSLPIVAVANGRVLFANQSGASGGASVYDQDGNSLGGASWAPFPPGGPWGATLLANGDILLARSGAVRRYSSSNQLLDEATLPAGAPGSPVELANGNILLVYANGNQLTGQIVSPTLDNVGTSFSISNNADYGSMVVALAGGGFVVSQSSFNAVGNVQAYNASGVAVGPAVALSGDIARDVAALPDGGYVLVSSMAGHYFQTFNADGSARSAAVDLGVGGIGSVAVLDGDLFVVTFRGLGGTSWAQLAHASGHLLGESFQIAADRAGRTVTAIDADTFVTHDLGSTSGERGFWEVDRPNILIGDATAESFDGGGSTDRIMVGLGGDDTYLVDSAGDIVNEWAGEGNDTVLATGSYQLKAGLSVETLATSDDAGTAALNLTGNELAQTLRGNAGANQLNGAQGADVMIGLGGDDLYFVDNEGDEVVEAAGEGNDRIYASAISYTLAAGSSVEILSTDFNAGTDGRHLTGNELANTILGNNGANTLTGNDGNDILDGKGADDFLYGGGNDDILYGRDGNDRLYGGAGANYLEGGTGDDYYYIDSATDRVVEAVGQGNDRVYASVSYALGAGASVELMRTSDDAGTAAINLTGNETANAIFGNAGANLLDGGGGADELIGLGGDDSYVVDNMQDVIFEVVGEGNDRVYASASFVLASHSNVETMSTTDNAGTGAINLTGNALANTILGNAGANVLSGGNGNDVLDGKEGNDTLYGGANDDILYGRDGNDLLYGGAGTNYLDGGAGDDQFVVDNATDTVVELAGQGADRVYAGVSYALAAGASVEVLSTDFNAGTTNVNLTGNELSNTLFGNAGNNILNGGAGKDWLDGKGGQDIFLFNTALNTAAGTPYAALAATANVDLIVGFAFDDKIGLSATLFGMTPGALSANAFVVGTAAADADDRIIYDSATGALLFDADGNGAGAAQLFAYLNGPFNLDASFFAVI